MLCLSWPSWCHCSLFFFFFFIDLKLCFPSWGSPPGIAVRHLSLLSNKRCKHCFAIFGCSLSPRDVFLLLSDTKMSIFHIVVSLPPHNPPTPTLPPSPPAFLKGYLSVSFWHKDVNILYSDPPPHLPALPPPTCFYFLTKTFFSETSVWHFTWWNNIQFYWKSF